MTAKSGWTPERRARQREAIQRWRPWESSTGPRTVMGKSVAARNSFRGGRLRDRQRSELRDIKAKINQIFQELDELLAIKYDNT